MKRRTFLKVSAMSTAAAVCGCCASSLAKNKRGRPNILLLFSKYPDEDEKHAVGLCARRRAFSDEAVLGVLRNEPLRPTTRLDLSDRPDLLEVDSGVRPANIYDQLLDGEEVAA